MSEPERGGPRAHHLAMFCRNLEAMRAFYEGALGMPVVREVARADGSVRSAWLRMGESMLFLEEEPERPFASNDAYGFHLLAFHVEPDERASLLDGLRAQGFAVYDETAFTSYVLDPEGNRVGFSHWPEEAA